MADFLYNIPLSTDQLSLSQGNINNNFAILGAIAGNTTPASNSIAAGSGFKWVYFPSNNASQPPVGSAFPSNQIALYSATSPSSGKNELYINKNNNAASVQVPATESILSNHGELDAGSQGYTYLPSGILLKWGTVINIIPSPTSVGVPNVVNANAFGPNFTQIIQVQLTGVSPSAGVGHFAYEWQPALFSSPSATTFSFISYWGNIVGQGVYWLAIGY